MPDRTGDRPSLQNFEKATYLITDAQPDREIVDAPKPLKIELLVADSGE